MVANFLPNKLTKYFLGAVVVSLLLSASVVAFDCGKSAAELKDELVEIGKAVAKSKPTEEVLLRRANAYFELGRTDEARKDALEILKVNPANAEALFLLGDIYDTLASYAWANLYYTKAIASKPDWALAYYARGRVRVFRNENLAAINDFRRAIELDGEYIKAHYGLGKQLSARGDKEKANESYQNGLSIAATLVNDIPTGPCLSRFLVSRSNLFSGLKMYNEALTDLDEACLQHGRNEQAFYYRAFYHATVAKDDLMAIEDLTTAITIMPDYALAYKARAEAYQRLKLDDKARADLEKYRTLSSTEPPNQGSR